VGGFGAAATSAALLAGFDCDSRSAAAKATADFTSP
jgi:hypothetical protein